MQSLADPGSSLCGQAEEDFLLTIAEADDGNHLTAPYAVPRRGKDLRTGRCRHWRAVLIAVHQVEAAGGGPGIEAMSGAGDHQRLQGGAMRMSLSGLPRSRRLLSTCWHHAVQAGRGHPKGDLVCENSSRVQPVASACKAVRGTVISRAYVCAGACAWCVANARGGARSRHHADRRH